MLQEGKINRYVLLVFGETLLVVIGILLAFQVDRWYEGRLNRIEELKYYKNLKGDLEQQRSAIKGQLAYNGDHLVRFQYALELSLSGNRSALDTLTATIPYLFNYSDYDQSGNIYETLVNSGDIKLMENDQIVKGIRELEWRYQYINRMENIHWDVILEYVARWASVHIKFAELEALEPQKLYSFEFQNLLILLQRIMNEKQTLYQSTINEIDQLLEEVNTEIDKES